MQIGIMTRAPKKQDREERPEPPERTGGPDAGRAEEPGHRSVLTRQDLIVFEQRLCAAINGIFPFTSHSLHFPRKLEGHSASWIAGEKKLLLPVPGPEGNLGIFVARGVDAAPRGLLSHWPVLGALLADNLLLYKRSLCDPITGLFTRHYLLRCMERAIESMRDATETDALAQGAGTRRGSLACLVARLADLRDVVREFGYRFADELMQALADAVSAVCPQQALAARTGDAEFAVYLPAASPAACRELASGIVAALGKVQVLHPLRREHIGISALAGYALYPLDLSGDMFTRPAAEQARVMLRKARLAAALASDRLPSRPGRLDPEGVMGFGRILVDGGRVLERLPMSRALVSLGSNVNAREGRRFSVWSSRFPGGEGGRALSPLYKGEIVLMEVYDDMSQAEIIHLGEPAWDIEAGDFLLLLPDEQGGHAGAAGGESRLDPDTGLLRHGDFLARWARERESAASFSLVLMRVAPRKNPAAFFPARPGEEGGGAEEEFFPEGEDGGPPLHPAQFMAEAARICRAGLGRGVLGGRFGLNSLVFYCPHGEKEERRDVSELAEVCRKLVLEMEKELDLDVSVGIAPHPCLDFRKAHALENSRKALEYAMLLPAPHVGVLDSLALNISADKNFSRGDIFAAIREYQAALLADEKNSLAWNSLGICLAGLSRHAEAETHFSRALECDPDYATAYYNLGYVHQSMGLDEKAGDCYKACLDKDPDNVFALIRLGQLAETGGDHGRARGFYRRAAGLPGGERLTYRHFARLALLEGNEMEARECLHEALLFDPQDAPAMALLARIYLDAGEDPDIAASFARQSVSLRPDLKSGWVQLSRALQALGRDDEARDARLKAGV
ncbi:MAG: tetratricopeptide repeat protein [Desulfovibrio sp.]|jgi:GGDEF domain-containing protein/Tfp pilus assembly protein PilF|nr:tetratricopeptide repeat protein [Desulfovibrio sp.]